MAIEKVPFLGFLTTTCGQNDIEIPKFMELHHLIWNQYHHLWELSWCLAQMPSRIRRKYFKQLVRNELLSILESRRLDLLKAKHLDLLQKKLDLLEMQRVLEEDRRVNSPWMPFPRVHITSDVEVWIRFALFLWGDLLKSSPSALSSTGADFFCL